MKHQELTPQAQEALQTRYRLKYALQSVAKLSQGEKDVLEIARDRLGWPSILSLAHKYYRLYPARKWWQRAIEKASHEKLRTTTLNIVYLLKTLQTISKQSLQAAYNGRPALDQLHNRLTHYNILKKHNRLTPQGQLKVNNNAYQENPFINRLISSGVIQVEATA